MTTQQASQAVHVARFSTNTERAAQQSHVDARLAARDAFFLTVNHDHSRGETRAQSWERLHGTPFTGRNGHVSLD